MNKSKKKYNSYIDTEKSAEIQVRGAKQKVITRCGTRNENRFQISLKATVLKLFSSNFQHLCIDVLLTIH